MKPEMQALLLMLNALRLQIFALSWAVTRDGMTDLTDPNDPRECLAASARLADMAMEMAGLTEAGTSPSTGKAT